MINLFLSQKQQKKLLEIARTTLECYLKNRFIPEIKIKDENFNQKCGVFVTIKKNGQLRGCIGEFESDLPLYKLVQKKVIDSALHDPRFPSMDLDELKSSKIAISILSPFQKINNWQDIKLGKHGVFIKRGDQCGTFLPQVAQETNWGLEEFLSNLCSIKAGLPPDSFKDPRTEIFVYTTQAFTE